MPAPIPDFVTYCCELLSAVGRVSPRRMFGGYSFYADDVIFAVFIWDELYLRVDPETKPLFERAGGKPFRYESKTAGKFAEMPYWTAPETAMESPSEMAHWARLAFAAANRARLAKATKAVKTPKKVVAKKPVKAAVKR
jgi:DNA transformation protein and related proteins